MGDIRDSLSRTIVTTIPGKKVKITYLVLFACCTAPVDIS